VLKFEVSQVVGGTKWYMYDYCVLTS